MSHSNLVAVHPHVGWRYHPLRIGFLTHVPDLLEYSAIPLLKKPDTLDEEHSNFPRQKGPHTLKGFISLHEQAAMKLVSGSRYKNILQQPGSSYTSQPASCSDCLSFLSNVCFAVVPGAAESLGIAVSVRTVKVWEREMT